MNKSISFKKTGLAVAFFALSAAAHAQVDSLQNVVREALEYNPEVQAKFNEFEATTHDRREAFGGYLPSLDIEGSLGTAERQYDDGRGAFTRNYAEARLTQMLFDGFQVKNRVKRAEHASRQRYYDLIDEAETKAMEVVNAYIDVERYREMVRLAQVNLDNHKRVQKQIAERADRGVSNQADLPRSTVVFRWPNPTCSPKWPTCKALAPASSDWWAACRLSRPKKSPRACLLPRPTSRMC